MVLNDLRSPPEWNRELERLVEISKSKAISVLVTGPKSSGKSTFGRILTNQLLTCGDSSEKKQNGVAILDLDPGQPEHCIAGQIALVHVTEPLLGPSFCRPLPGLGIRVVRSHTLASISPASDPELYLAAAADLFTYYRNSLGSCPIVINTAGWIQGTGLDLLASLIDTIRPTNVVYMATGPVDVVQTLQDSFRTGQLTKLPSQNTAGSSRHAAHLRAMQLMSYFHAEIDVSGKVAQASWNTNPITAFPPWQIRYTDPSPGILVIMCYDYQAPPELLAEAINGTILAVVVIESPLAFRTNAAGGEIEGDPDMRMDIDENQDAVSLSDIRNRLAVMTPEGIPFINNGNPLDPRYSQTIGLLLVRGIDTANDILEVLTPIEETRIAEINDKGGHIVLVSGKFDPPAWAYTEDLHYQSSQQQGEQDEEDEHEDETMNSMEDTQRLSEVEQSNFSQPDTPTPWIQLLQEGESRGTGKVWRVRRDLGRTAT